MICALSGGVDSTVAATLVHKVVGDRLHCVFVDNGLLRYKVCMRTRVARTCHLCAAAMCHRASVTRLALPCCPCCGMLYALARVCACIAAHRCSDLCVHIHMCVCFCVSHTFQEQERVMDMFKNHLHLPVTCIDHSEAMLKRLAGLTDPEAKRKAIGAEFIEVFKNFRDNLEQTIGKRPKFLVQGTL